MKKVIIINGPAGVGKTTTSYMLAENFDSSVVIHGDDIKAFIIKKTDTIEKRLTYKNCGLLAASFLDAGYEVVIVEFVFENPEHIDHLKKYLKAQSGFELYMFTLWADLATCKAREESRLNRERLGARVDLSHSRIEQHINVMGTVIDTAINSTEDVVRQIMDKVSRPT